MTSQIMAYTTDYFVSYNDFNNYDKTTRKWALSKDFVRVDGVGKYNGDDVSAVGVKQLKDAATKLWTDNKTEIEGML